MNTHALTVGSLFSGIGGIDLGLQRAGMRHAWFCERDEFCRSVLRRHWPDAPVYTDVAHVGADTPPVDVLAAGFPCQPVSIAGRRAAQDDNRWLWPEVARIIGDLRPRYVLLENVPGLLTRGFGDVLGDLATLGFDAEWDCLPAAAFGAPHIRDRVFVVAYPSGQGLQRGDVRILADAGSWGQHPDPARPAVSALRPWPAEPRMARVADGVPAQVDRTRALGNAVVPAVDEWVGRCVMADAGRPCPYCAPDEGCSDHIGAPYLGWAAA